MVQNEPKRRGRPRSFDEDAVLETARGVFWSLGYAATSLDDLAAATGLNRPSLYAAFGDKHALYMRALENTRAGAVAGMQALMQREGPLRQVLAGLFVRAIQGYTSGEAARGCFIIGTATVQAVDDPDARALLARFVADEDAVFRDRFRRAANELAPGIDPEDAAAMATAALHTLAIRARMGDPREALDRVAKGAVAVICGPG
jgi:AcrR family transcriptional regulator